MISTRLRPLRLGKPFRSEGCRAAARRAKVGRRHSTNMKYVYILESLESEHFYVGVADDVSARLIKHNAGEVPHTSKYRPWRVKTYVAFTDAKRALAFEKYLKSGSGRAFAKKRL
jgi:predicted GIY-YIG superfamily endonuclease